MKLAIVTIATALFLGGILVNLVSDDIANRLSYWLGPNYEPVIYIGFALVLILDVWLFAKNRLRPKLAPPSDQVRGEFEAIWPAFFQTLEDDLRRSEASAELARIRAKDRNPHPGIQIHSPNVETQFTVYHRRTVSNYDHELGGLLRSYLGASDRLRISANSYNQILYSDLLEEWDLEGIERLDRRIDYQLAKEDMYEKSRVLEDAIDNLRLKLKYYRDLNPS